ncbi:PEP5 [Zalerion maritima]|uniref:PEP5 n=1 Tax=Zalerion maritima TaxID=339359 RepID=A0AAD5RRW1_9PEZI|nr:PEP5 [Zalerion maritima]
MKPATMSIEPTKEQTAPELTPVAASETSSPAGEKSDVKETIEDREEPIPHLHIKTYLTVFAVCFIYFAQLINVVGAGAQTQTIVSVLGGSENSVWLTSVLTIMTVVLSPIVSQAADYWGRRWFLVGLTFMGVPGSIIVARAKNIDMAIAGFTVTALSYGAQPLLHAVASEVLPRRYRPHGQAADNAAAALGGLTALLVGGAMTRNSNAEGFRNYWYMSTAFYFVATALTLALYNPPKTKKELEFTNKEKLAKLDWIGYFLLASGLVLFCVGLSWSRNPYPWSDPHVSATFAIGCAFAIALGVYEWKFKKDGMFHHGLFQGRNFSIAVGCVFVEGLVFFAANNYFAFQVSVLYETDALITGLRYGINMIVYAVAAVLAGFYCSMTKNVKWPTVVAFVSMIIFFVLMATSNPSTSDQVWGYPVFLGIGLGVCLCSLVTIAQLSTPPELIAITSGLMIGMRSLGGSIGLAIYNAIFVEKLTSSISSKIPAAVLPLGLPATSLGDFITYLTNQQTDQLATVEGVTPDIIHAGVDALLESYTVGFRFVWIAAGCFTVVAAVAAVFIRDQKQEFNMHIDNPAEKEDELYASS